MKEVFLMTFILSFSLVATNSHQKEKNDTKEILNDIIYLNKPSTFKRVEKVEPNNEGKFWKITDLFNDTVDGNHPDNSEITTHEHVDKIVGYVPPTKRVKKILPPFDDNKKRNIRDVKILEEKLSRQKGVANNSWKEILIEKKSLELKSEIKSVKAEQNTEKLEDGEGNFPQSDSNILTGDNKTAVSPHYDKFTISENATWEKANTEFMKIKSNELSTTASTTEQKQQASFFSTSVNLGYTESYGEIKGIRLVPYEINLLLERKNQNEEEGEEEGEEEFTMQKSIWDLLKEREQSDSNHFYNDSDLEEKNKTSMEPITEQPLLKNTQSKSIYDHFDAESAEVEFEMENFKRGYSNIEKHELPLSYALPWLQAKDKEFENKKKPPSKSSNKNLKKEGIIPKDVSKLLKLGENKSSVNGVTVSIINSGNSHSSNFGHRPSKWYILLLTGNSTIVKLRKNDFTKYLKLNLAARLSVEYDDVKVNKVILAPPKVLVNVSVFATSDDVAEESQLDFKEKSNDKGEAPLYKLAQTNATLLELSGEEYHVIRFLSLESQKPEAEARKDEASITMASRQSDIEFIIYIFLGSACSCALILTFFVTLSKYYRKVTDFDWPWLRPKQSAWKVHKDDEPDKDEFNGISPAVIYSGGFPQIRGSWMNGLGSRSVQQSVVQQCSNIEMGSSPPHRKTPSFYPEVEDRSCDSPRHSKLQIYNCDANSLVIQMPIQGEGRGKGNTFKNEGSNIHPLDVRIRGGKKGQDNPIFTN